jgi:hypothetical protein
MAGHIERRQTQSGLRYRVVVSIGHGRGSRRVTRTTRTKRDGHGFGGEHVVGHAILNCSAVGRRNVPFNPRG